MEKIPANIENFINSNWNHQFPNYPITAVDLKKPHTVIGAVLHVFDHFGINREALLMPPPEESRNEHTIYYWDLLPVINMTRVFNHLLQHQMDFTISISYFLQPTIVTSHSMLKYMWNMMLFNEERLRDIEPLEGDLFAKTDEVKVLDDRKNKLLEMLNEQAEEKGKRAERLEKLDIEIKQLEEEIKQEKEAHEKEKLELEAMLDEDNQLEILLEQKRSQRDALNAEIEKKQALRVYDADDIKNKVEQAKQNCQEAEEKLNTLRETLLAKENSLKNLQNITPNLETANNLLSEIMKLADNLRDYETGDLETDSKEGELDVLYTEMNELEEQLSELRAARADAAAKRLETQAKIQQEAALIESCLREAEEKDKKGREKCNKAAQRIQEIQAAIVKYKQEKAEGFEELANIRKSFVSELNSVEDALRKKVLESKEKIEEKLRQRKC